MALSPRLKRNLQRPRRRRVLLAQTWWEDRVLRGVADYATKHDWELDCRMRWTHRLPENGHEVDGIIVNAGISPLLRLSARALVDFVSGSGLPVVDMQEFSDIFHAPKVIVPQAETGVLAARHLIDIGCSHVGYVGFGDNPLELARRDGFRDEVRRAGRVFLDLNPKTLAKALPSLPVGSGLAALNDVNALQVIRLALDAGRRVPEEIAVLGADDTDILCDLATVPLSSVSSDFEKQGWEAAALLDRLMKGIKPPAKPLLIPPRGVTVRRSTDSVAMPDLDSARMLRFLRDHFRETFSITQAADAINVPLRRVQLAFKKHLGRSLLQELTHLRVAEAKRRLGEEKPPKLEVVARESGFSNRFHFIQAFRRTTKMSPRAWRLKKTEKKDVEPSAVARATR